MWTPMAQPRGSPRGWRPIAWSAMIPYSIGAGGAGGRPLDDVALYRGLEGRGPEPTVAARSRCDGPGLRGAARRPRRGRGGLPLRGPLHPQLPRLLRRDATPLPPTSPCRAGDVPAARDRAERHRRLLRRRLHEPGDVQPDIPGHRRRDAVGVPTGARADRGAPLLPDGCHAAPAGGGRGGAIEQFWRSICREGALT